MTTKDIIYAILQLLGGLGAFLIGAKMLSDNTEKLANSKVRQLFNKTSKNKTVGVLIGTSTTAIVQSSGLTTVMVVGLVNAGVMTLYQATTIIMGANIGTTITAHIAALQDFKIDKIAIVLCCLGIFINMFAKKDKTKTIGHAFAGIGLVFMGLMLMSGSMLVFNEIPGVKELFSKINNPLLLLVIGIVVTALIQSSSAITTILVSMATTGLVLGEGGNAFLFVILGSNIGSCVTALMSSIGASTNAKRASFIHLLFNFAGAILFFIIFLLWPSFMDVTFGKWFAKSPGTQLAMFHTFFNVFCTLIFVPFTSVFVFIATKVIVGKKQDATASTYLDKRFLSTPAIAMEALAREAIKMLDMSMHSLDFALDGFLSKSEEKISEVLRQNDEIIKVSKEIADYLVLTSSKDLTFSDEKLISALHQVNGDILRISELADNIVKYTRRSISEDLIFSDQVTIDIKNMYKEITMLAEKTKEVLIYKSKKMLSEVDAIEDTIDKYRKDLINDHIERMNSGLCRAENSTVFVNLVNNLERVGDHLTFVAHSIEEI